MRPGFPAPAGTAAARVAIVFSVRDEVSGRTFEAREPFRVEPPGPRPGEGAGPR